MTSYWFDFYTGEHSVDDNGVVTKKPDVVRSALLRATDSLSIEDLKIELHSQFDKAIDEAVLVNAKKSGVT